MHLQLGLDSEALRLAVPCPRSFSKLALRLGARWEWIEFIGEVSVGGAAGDGGH